MKFKCIKGLLTGMLLSVVLLGNVANAALIKFELHGFKPGSPSDVFSGSVTFDTLIAPDEGGNTLEGIVEFQMSFPTHSVNFTLPDLTSASWYSIANNLTKNGLPLGFSFAASSNGFTLSTDAGTSQSTSFNGFYTNGRATIVPILPPPPPLAPIAAPEPTTIAVLALGMIGLASRRFKKHS